MTRPDWLIEYGAHRTGTLWLVSVPYAGGGASVYSSWAPFIPSHVRLFALQLPGRESRFAELPFSDMQDLVETAGPVLSKVLREPFMFFGHSAGALIAFALAQWLESRFELRARKLIVSASRAPNASCVCMHDLPEGELRRRLSRMGGIPAELLQNKELMDLISPSLRADLRLVETYRCGDRITSQLVAFGGTADPLATEEALQAWRAHTCGAFSVAMIPGDHFFIRKPALALPYIIGELTEPLTA